MRFTWLGVAMILGCGGGAASATPARVAAIPTQPPAAPATAGQLGTGTTEKSAVPKAVVW